MMRYVARRGKCLTLCELVDSLGEPLILLALLVVGGSSAVAAPTSFSWNALNGQFNDSANWVQTGPIDFDGVPDADDIVTFRRGSFVSYTVTFPGARNGAGSPVDYVSDQLQMGNNNVSFTDANSILFPFPVVPSTYSVDNPTTAESGRGMIVGASATDTAAVLTTRLAMLSAVAATIGDVAGSNGTLNVNAGTFSVSGSDITNIELIIGRSGAGAMNVSGGADVSVTKGAALGEYTGSTGTASVSGSSSIWTNGGDLSVGYSGNGTLHVINSGRVSNKIGLVGAESGSTGTVTVDGAGSTWTNSEDLIVGHSGAGTLNISNGSQVYNGYGTVGFQAASVGTVTVDGVGSTWTNSYLYVAYSGAGTLNISNGGRVGGDNAYVGYRAGSMGKVTDDGAGSNLISGNLYVGYDGAGIMSITNGGQVTSGPGYVGFEVGSTGMASVDGGGSKWTSDGDLYVGFDGTGTLSVANSGTVQATNVNVGALGEVHGNGLIICFDNGNMQNGGLVSPGNSPGTLHITGNYTQTTAGKLLIELAGTAPGTQYDQLLVTSTATLDGTLDVSLLGGFTPSAGNSFDVLTTTGGVTGTFAIQQLPLLAGGLVWNLSYGTNDVILSVGGVLGDYNHNGTVDAADYVVWRKGLGTIYTQSDYNVWRANFGQTTGSGVGTITTAAVPEPTTLAMVIIGAFAMCSRRRRAAAS